MRQIKHQLVFASLQYYHQHTETIDFTPAILDGLVHVLRKMVVCFTPVHILFVSPYDQQCCCLLGNIGVHTTLCITTVFSYFGWDVSFWIPM